LFSKRILLLIILKIFRTFQICFRTFFNRIIFDLKLNFFSIRKNSTRLTTLLNIAVLASICSYALLMMSYNSETNLGLLPKDAVRSHKIKFFVKLREERFWVLLFWSGKCYSQIKIFKVSNSSILSFFSERSHSKKISRAFYCILLNWEMFNLLSLCISVFSNSWKYKWRFIWTDLAVNLDHIDLLKMS